MDQTIISKKKNIKEYPEKISGTKIMSIVRTNTLIFDFRNAHAPEPLELYRWFTKIGVKPGDAFGFHYGNYNYEVVLKLNKKEKFESIIKKYPNQTIDFLYLTEKYKIPFHINDKKLKQVKIRLLSFEADPEDLKSLLAAFGKVSQANWKPSPSDHEDFIPNIKEGIVDVMMEIDIHIPSTIVYKGRKILINYRDQPLYARSVSRSDTELRTAKKTQQAKLSNATSLPSVIMQGHHTP